MVSGGRDPNGGWQEDDSEGGSSSRSDDVPANLPNYPNDASLTGSSYYGSRPQGSGPTTPFYTQNPPLFPYDPLDPYSCQLNPQSGPSTLSQFPRGFPTLTQTWPINQVTDAQTAGDMTRYYPSPQYTPGDASLGNARHHIDRSSPFYPTGQPDNTTVQPTRHQPHIMHYTDDRRPSLSQLHAPTPHQPIDCTSLPSPPRSNSSYSHTGTTPQRLGHHIPLPPASQWSPPFGQSSRSASDSTTATHLHSDAGSRSPIYPLVVAPYNGSSQGLYSTPPVQPPPYLGEMSSYPPYPPSAVSGDGPRFPEPQFPPEPSPTRGERVRRVHPYRQTKKKVPRSDESPVASGSGVTTDMLPRQARGRRQRLQTTAQKKDAERKKGERAKLKLWFDRVASLLPSSPSHPDTGTYLQLLTRVIEHLGGTPPALVDYPKNYDPNKKRGEKSHANGVRAHNESRAFDAIRALLRATGRFDIRENTSYCDILRIVVYLLLEMNGMADEELARSVKKFFNPPGSGTL